jgi:CHAT domain-containing protein
LHAAGVYEGPSQECCADYIVSSYTPTLTALLRAQQTSTAYPRENIKVLTVAAEYAQDPALPRLRFVRQEVESIAEVTANTDVQVASLPVLAIKDQIISALETANVVHLACHGIQDATEPHESHFSLGGGILTVSDLMKTDLKHAFFAFLSACETAKGDRTHVDEVVHLAATMLFTGFKSVVATMW